MPDTFINVNVPYGTLQRRIVDVSAAGDNSENAEQSVSIPRRGTVQKGGPGGPAPDQAFQRFLSTAGVNINAGATVSTGYTVPTGRKWFNSDLYVSGNTATQFPVTIQGATVPKIIFFGFAKGDTGPIQLTGILTPNELVNADGQLQLIFGAAATTTAAYYVAGYEQPVASVG